jgi:hypothetical protein
MTCNTDDETSLRKVIHEVRRLAPDPRSNYIEPEPDPTGRDAPDETFTTS